MKFCFKIIDKDWFGSKLSKYVLVYKFCNKYKNKENWYFSFKIGEFEFGKCIK